MNLSEEDIRELKEKFPTKDVMFEYEAAQDWLRAEGKRKKDYKAFMRNWLRRSKDVRRFGGTNIMDELRKKELTPEQREASLLKLEEMKKQYFGGNK
jgi:hypothetical protein